MQTVKEQLLGHAVNQKVTQLQLTLVEEQKKSRRNLYMLAGMYVLMIAWSMWDTAHVFDQIKEMSAPQKVASLAVGQLRQQLPAVQQDLVAHVRNAAPQIATNLLQAGHKAIPETEKQLQQQLTQAADQLSANMDARVPAITEFLSTNLQDTIKAANYASDADLSKALVRETVQALDKELQTALNPTLFAGIFKTRTEVEQLVGKPQASLSPEERSTKMALLNALRITELAQGQQHSSLLAQGVRAILGAVLPKDMMAAMDKPLPN